jgi:hypothetical protein
VSIDLIAELRAALDAECVTCGPRWPRRTVEALAAPYADHPDYPDYREEWRP